MSEEEPRQRPLDVTIVLLPESSIMSLASVLDPMRAANRVVPEPVFRWKILSPQGRPVLLTCGVEIRVDGAFADVTSGDALLLIAGFNQDRHADRAFVARLKKVARRFGIVAGIESGCWLLARSGLLDGRDATAHLYEQLFRGAPALEEREAAQAARWRDTQTLTWGLAATRADRSTFTGRGVRVAVLDTGFDFTHPDFPAARVQMLTTVTPAAQLLSIVSSGASPPNAAP